MPINAAWHKAHPMPKNPSLEQRLAWHVEHQKHCACRPLTPKLRQQLAERAQHGQRQSRSHPNLRQLLEQPWTEGRCPKDLFVSHVAKAPPRYVEEIVAGLSDPERRVQNGYAELASLLSESAPELVYPHIGIFIENVHAREAVLRWEAVCTLGNLAPVDNDRVLLRHVPTLVKLLHDKSIVLQGHTVRALTKIAAQNPNRAPQILKALPSAKDRFPGHRVGYLIEAMEHFGRIPGLRESVLRFVEPFSRSEVPSLATKAKRVLRALKTQ